MHLDLTSDEREIREGVREAARRAPADLDVDGWWALLDEQGLLHIRADSGDEALALGVVAEAIGHELVPVHFGAHVSLAHFLEAAAAQHVSPQLDAAAASWSARSGRGFALGHEVADGVCVVEPVFDRVETVVLRRGTAGWTVLAPGEFTLGASSEWTGAPMIHTAEFDAGAPVVTVPGRDPNQLNVLLHAAELVGVAREAASRSRDYLVTREQFGRPIGSFQALQHRAVDVAAAVAAAEALVEFAIWSWGDRPDDPALDAWVHAAAGLAAETGLHALSEAFTFHGGIAMTSELWVHRWHRRAVRLASFQGDGTVHLERVGAALADEGATLTVPIAAAISSPERP